MNDLQRLTTHRRALHQIPELSRELPRTKAYILSVLKQLECEITEVLESGVCAYFHRGRPDTTAFRADMDALPVTEVNTCSYASRHPGNMHACGHDGHMAMVLTLAQYVDAHKELPYNVLLIFQPAEETTGGARDICQTGILQKYNVCRIFAFHLWPFLEAGKLTSKPGAMMPRSSEITVEITGKSAHATSPESGIDALYIGCHYIEEIYRKQKALLPPNPRPEEKTIIQICRMDSGTARNVIAGSASLLGTMRAFSDETFTSLVSILEETASDLEKKYGCKIDAMHSEGYPPIINDPDLYHKISPILSQAEYIEMEKPVMISEDYSFFGLEVPSVFFFVGTGTNIALHSHNFDFDEKILLSGFDLYCRLLEAKN